MAAFDDGGGSSSSLGSSFSRAISGAARNVGSSVSRSTRRAAPRRRSSSSGSRTTARQPSQRSYSPQPTARRAAPARPAVGSTSRGTVAPSVPAPRPQPMSLEQWLASDTSFQSQKNAYDKALKDYAAQDLAERQKYENEYGASMKKFNTEKGDAQTALTDDYSSRGLITSGLYADALGDFQNTYAQKQADQFG